MALFAPRAARRRPRLPTNLTAGAAIVLVVTLVAASAPALAPLDPDAQSLADVLEGPQTDHPLGLDDLGRDVLSRIVVGTRVSVGIAAAVVVISVTVGLLWGLLAGWFGGWIDEVGMRLTDVLLAFPGILLAMAVVAVTGPSVWNLVVALSLTGWVGQARLVRSLALRQRGLDHVVAARALGAGDARILCVHVLPACLPAVLVQATLAMGGVIVAEAGLSFLGLGVAGNAPSWGEMLQAGTLYYRLAPHLTIVPGACIALTVLGFNFLGDGLRDVLDPRLPTSPR